MQSQRVGRQDAIRDIVRGKRIRTQRDLTIELRERGFSCTQTTISRDIGSMGLRKRADGTYVLVEDVHLEHMALEFVLAVESVYNQVVIKTQAGTASGVAVAIDAADYAEVIGTVAGNDTVLVICRSDADASAMTKLLLDLRRTKP